MARTGGRFPYDKNNALDGLARVVWAPLSVTAPTGLPIASVADGSGEYACITGWNDFGLAADAPTYTAAKDEGTLEYEQTGTLFRKINSITRQFQCSVAEIEPENMKIVENTTLTTAVAASAAGAPTKNAAATKLKIGRYTQLSAYRIALISYRPVGAGVVTEPGGATRPPLVALVLPQVTLAAEDTDIEFSSGDPVAAEIQFNAVDDQTQGAGAEHGYWYFEQPGTIVT